MSMAVHEGTPQGWGGCIAYGPPFSFGLPVDVPQDRPMVIAHPAAAAHHHASFGLVADGGHPFIHVLAEHGEFTPDGWGINANVAGMATWQRTADTPQGDKVYRKADVSTPHWQVHFNHEAFAKLTASPPVDVLYVDWLEWLDPHGVEDNIQFSNIMAAFIHKVREGGLVVVDHKHAHLRGGQHPWFSSLNEPVVHLNNGSMLINNGFVEWLSPDFYGDVQTHGATVFKVHHGVDGPLSQKDWDEAMQPWFWMTMPEVSMSLAQIEDLLFKQPSLPVHPDATTQEQWLRDWLRHQDEHEPGPSFLGPTPPFEPWPSGAYTAYLRWLLDHPSLLVDDVARRSYRLLGEAFTLHLVHGDLLRIAPALHGVNAVLAVREGLRKNVVGRCPRWLGQTLELQSPEPWVSNPVKGLTWSGEAATPQLAKTMLELAKQQPYSRAHPSIKPMQVDHVVTVSHGTASLGEVMEAVMAYYNALPPAMGRAPMQMTIVCLDENDYTDVQTVPHQFQFLPDDGSCAD